MISIHCIILLEEKATIIFQNYYYFPWYSSQCDQNYKRQSVQKYLHLYKVKVFICPLELKAEITWRTWYLSSKLQKDAFKYVIYSRKKWDIRTGWQNRELLILWCWSEFVQSDIYTCKLIVHFVVDTLEM